MTVSAAKWHDMINRLKEQAIKADIARRHELARKLRALIGKLDAMTSSAVSGEP